MKRRPKKTKATKLIFEHSIIHSVLFVLLIIKLVCILFVNFNDFSNAIRNLVKQFCPGLLDLPFVTIKLLFTIDLALFIVSIVTIATILYRSCAKTINIRNAHYVERMLSSDNSGEPACNRTELAKRIYGDKRSPNVPKKINDLIDESISPIKRYLDGNIDDNILTINAKWGAGKTTCLLIAINEVNRKDSRYIYESAFKYRINSGELFNDILTALRETLSELRVDVNNSIDTIAQNLDKDTTSVLLTIIKKRNEFDALSSDAIYRINEKYRKKKIANKIYIIIDDLDRLKGDDIVNILSFLSILRRLEFIRIIIPVDRAVIASALEAAGIIEPQLFIEKYLPSQKEVRIKSNYEMAYALVENIIKSKKENEGKDVRPAIEAVFLKMLSNEIKRQTFGFKNYRYLWLQKGAREAETTIDFVNEQIRQILDIPKIIIARNKDISADYSWSTGYNNIRETQNLVYALQKKIGSGRPTTINARRFFSIDDYNYSVKSWVIDFVERRWDLFGFTIREARNSLSGIEFGQLPESELEQFAHIYNQYNPTRRIEIEKDER